MNRRGSNFPRWKCKTVLALGLTSLLLLLCHTANTVTAQDQGSSTKTPATSEAAAKPAETPAVRRLLQNPNPRPRLRPKRPVRLSQRSFRTSNAWNVIIRAY